MKRNILVFALCLVGCAAGPLPERSYYLLRADPPQDLAPAPQEDAAGLGHVTIAAYLDRAGIVVQVGEHQVREARHHLWAEPLDRGVRSYLSDRIALRLGHALASESEDAGPVRYRIDVGLEQFHGSLNGETRLVARWSLRDLADDSLLQSQRFARTRPQSGDGYANLVKAQIALLDDLAEVIAEALRGI